MAGRPRNTSKLLENYFSLHIFRFLDSKRIFITVQLRGGLGSRSQIPSSMFPKLLDWFGVV